MKIKFTLHEAENCNYTHELEIPHADFSGMREDFERVTELHHLRSEKWRLGYIARWGQELYDKHYPSSIQGAEEGR